MAFSPESPDFLALDVIADEFGGIEHIPMRLNHESFGWKSEWGCTFTREDAVGSLTRLIEQDLVRASLLTEGLGVHDLGPGSLPEGKWDTAFICMTPRWLEAHSDQVDKY